MSGLGDALRRDPLLVVLACTLLLCLVNAVNGDAATIGWVVAAGQTVGWMLARWRAAEAAS